MKSLPSKKSKEMKEEHQQIKQYLYDADLKALARKMNQSDGVEANEEENTDDEHLKQAIHKAKEILSIARNGADQIREEARRKGYDEGHILGVEAGKKEGYNEYLTQIASEKLRLQEELEASLLEIEVVKKELLDQYIEDLKDVALSVAEKVIRVSLQTSSDIIKKMILSATEKLTKAQWAKIYISKLDTEIMLEGDTKFLSSLSNVSDNIKIIPVDTQEQGLCIIELPKEVIDASINTQMDNIKNIINSTQA